MTRGFSMERHLVRALKRGLSPELLAQTEHHKSMRVFHEVKVGTIIPDLVLILRESSFRKSVRLSEFDCWVFADILANGISTAPQIAHRLYSNPERTQLALQRMLKYGFVIQTDTGYVGSFNSYSSSLQVVSIEAKLTDWREALKQAKEYRRFSNTSYIALPETVLSKFDEIRSQCRENHVGLISVSRTGAEVVCNATKLQPPLNSWLWIVSKTVGLRPAR